MAPKKMERPGWRFAVWGLGFRACSLGGFRVTVFWGIGKMSCASRLSRASVFPAYGP